MRKITLWLPALWLASSLTGCHQIRPCESCRFAHARSDRALPSRGKSSLPGPAYAVMKPMPGEVANAVAVVDAAVPPSTPAAPFVTETAAETITIDPVETRPSEVVAARPAEPAKIILEPQTEEIVPLEVADDPPIPLPFHADGTTTSSKDIDTPNWVPADTKRGSITDLDLIDTIPSQQSTIAISSKSEDIAPITESTKFSAASSEQRTLSGEVQSWRGGWRLRYVSVDTDDAYGGSAVLEGAQIALHDGQQVRVQGKFIPPPDRFSSARFQVQTLNILNK